MPTDLNLKVDFPELLKSVNDIRLAIGIGEGKIAELPKGDIGNSDTCVLALALSNGWQANVDTHSISLVCPSKLIETFDFDSAMRTFSKLGYEYVDYDDMSGEICFTPTKNMINFIERFDEGEFPHLILED